MGGEGAGPCYSKWSAASSIALPGYLLEFESQPQTHWARICISRISRLEKSCSSMFCLGLHRSSCCVQQDVAITS